MIATEQLQIRELLSFHALLFSPSKVLLSVCMYYKCVYSPFLIASVCHVKFLLIQFPVSLGKINASHFLWPLFIYDLLGFFVLCLC
jgi:hypothetical protein